MKTAYRWFSWPAMVGLVLMSLLVGARPAAARVDDLADRIYQRLQAERAAGKTDAATVLANLEDFLARSRSSFDEAKRATLPDTVSAGGTARAKVVGLAPFFVKIHNVEKLRDEGQIRAYVARRSAALAGLTRNNPGQLVTVALSPSERLSLASFVALRDKYGLILTELSLDVVIDGRWDRMTWARENTTGHGTQLDFSSSAQHIRDELLDPIVNGPLARNETLQSRTDLASATFEVRYAVGRLSAERAHTLQSEPAIALVDPFDDLLQQVAGRAMNTRVVDMPQVFVQRMLNRGDFYPARRSASVAPREGTPLRVAKVGLASVSFVDGWKAWDHEYNDDPDGGSAIYSPDSITHAQGWYDYDSSVTCDRVNDGDMIWQSGAPAWWNGHLNDNWTLSQKVHHDLYEWDDLFWSNLPNIDHNEDDIEEEEPTNPWPYDEKEVGSTRPETFSPGTNYWVQTVACPLSFNGNGYIYSDSEWAGFFWSPIYGNDQLGYLFASGTW